MQDIIIRNLANYLLTVESFDVRVGLYVLRNLSLQDLGFLPENLRQLPKVLERPEDLGGESSWLLSDQNWTETIDVLVPIHFEGYMGTSVRELYDQLAKLNLRVTVNDQISCAHQINETAGTIDVSFRGLELTMVSGTVLPFGYVNDPFIEHVKGDCDSPLSMLDLCTGSGCIGLALMREIDSVNDLTLVDLSPFAIASAY